VPESADPTRPPSWRRIADEPVVRWHDRRALWTEAEPPTQVAAEPDRVHRVREWVVPLRDDLAPVEIHGTLDWLPPPDPLRWWAVVLLGVGAVGALGLAPTAGQPGPTGRAGQSRSARWAGRAATLVLGSLTAAGGAAGIGYAVLREIDAGTAGPGAVTLGLLTGQTLVLLTGTAALAAGGYTVLRRPGGSDFPLALTGACLAIFTGVANAAVLARAVAPTPGPALWTRTLIALVLVTGAGSAVAAVLRLRAAARTDGGPPADHVPAPTAGSNP
jgi:hypothetical protein